MEIRKALLQDLDQIMQIYENAKAFMRANGNKEQWETVIRQENL